MIQFKPVDEFLDLEGISLPIRGKDYVIPPPDAITGLEVTRLMAAVMGALDGADIGVQLNELADVDEKAGGELELRVLGPALAEMQADGVPWPLVKLAFQTAMVWIAQGAETAARFWGSGGGMVGKAPSRPTRQPTRKVRRASTGSRSRKK